MYNYEARESNKRGSVSHLPATIQKGLQDVPSTFHVLEPHEVLPAFNSHLINEWETYSANAYEQTEGARQPVIS